jgi:predicted RNA-binding Zn ribbon-like protein
MREALRAFLLANARLPLAPEAAEAFDDAAGPAHLRARADERGRLELLPAEEGGLDHAIGRLVAIVFAAQQDGTWFRLKVCAECHWALYDHTKNHSAAWCGSKCGARVRSRRYRQRHGSPA